MEIEKNISDDKDRNMEDRILASSRYYELDLELLKLNYDKKIKLAQGNESEIALIEQKYKFDVSS